MDGLASELLDLLGVGANYKIDVGEKPDDGPRIITVQLESEDSKGILIGHRGESLRAIETFLTVALRNLNSEEWVRVLVNVGDWRQKQEKQLHDLADQSASRAISTGEDQPLYNLTSDQRRLIHTYLAERNDVETESFGESRDRYMVVRVKAK